MQTCIILPLACTRYAGTHTTALKLTFCDTTLGNGAGFRTHVQKTDRRETEGQIDLEVEIVI